MTSEERKRCAEAIVNSRLAKEFLASEFWLQTLGPWLRDDAEDAANKCLYVPRMNLGGGLEGVGMQTIFNSGMAAQITRLQEQMTIWIAKGKDAQEELERDNKALEKETK